MRTKPCFVCEVVAGANEFPRHFVHEDDRTVAFLDAFPKAYGYVLAAPKEHRERVTGAFRGGRVPGPPAARLPRRGGGARGGGRGADVPVHVRLGGVAHVHWHVVPLPPGVPYEDQQGAWASWSKGVLEIPQEEMASLAARIGRRMEKMEGA